MQQLKTGQFFGTTNQTIRLSGITLTDTEYTHEHVDWHYHENPYFTFILQGKVLEGNKKETYHCGPGTLLFHNWQEAHYNIKPKGFTRGFHIELEKKWFVSSGIDTDQLQGNFSIADPAVKMLMYQILRESKISGGSGSLAIDVLLTELFVRIAGNQQVNKIMEKYLLPAVTKH